MAKQEDYGMRRPRHTREYPGASFIPMVFFKAIAGPDDTPYPEEPAGDADEMPTCYFGRRLAGVTYEKEVGATPLAFIELDVTDHFYNLDTTSYIEENSVVLCFDIGGRYYTIDKVRQDEIAELMLAAGGRIDGASGLSATRHAYLYSSATSVWTATTDSLTEGTTLLACIGNDGYAIGPDRDAFGFTTLLAKFVLADETWSTEPAPPAAPYTYDRTALAALGTDLWVHYGNFDRYDTPAQSWSVVSDVPTSPDAGETSFSFAAAGGKLYRTGGYNGRFETPPEDHSYFEDEHEEYDPAGGTWSIRADLPTYGRHLHAATDVGGLHVFGGYTNTLDLPGVTGGGPRNLGDHDAYDAATDTWSGVDAAAPGEPRGASCCTFRDGAVLLGGFRGAGTVHGSTVSQTVSRWQTSGYGAIQDYPDPTLSVGLDAFGPK